MFSMKLALFAVVLVLFFATGVITLLGIIQRVQIERKYLNALFSALILELIAAVLFLFSEADFFAEPPEPDPRLAIIESWQQQNPELNLNTALQAAASEQSTAQELAAAQQEIRSLQREFAELQTQLAQTGRRNEQQKEQIELLNSEIEVRRAAVVRLSKLERQFLVRMADLNSKISDWGASVNLRWQPEQKREIALLLQEAFKEIGFMAEHEIPDGDPVKAHDILLRYQQEKKFKETGFLTHQTVALLIQDYLSPGLQN